MWTTFSLFIAALALAACGVWLLAPARFTLFMRALYRFSDLPVDSEGGHGRSRPLRRADDRAAQSRMLIRIVAPAAIVVGALLLRTIDLSGSPPGFFVDEASNALDANAIFHTLHDQHGNLLPAYFQALGDWRGSLFVYLVAPLTGVFGLSEISVRLGAALIGALTVWFVYVFVSKAVNRRVGLVSAFLLAISPWHILQSRTGWDVVTIPFVTALCLTFLYYGFERPRLLPAAFVTGALGLYTYFSGRLFFPLFCAAWVAIYAPRLWVRRRETAIGIVLAGIVTIPAVIALATGTFYARFNQTSIPNQSLGDRLSMFWTNYLAHFQSGFLFDTSTDWITRLYVRGFGMLYGVEAPFLVIGVAAMLLRRRRADVLFLIWFLIYPISAALVGPPVSTRSITGVIVFQIAVAEGIILVVQAIARSTRRAPWGRAVVVTTATVLAVTGLATAAGYFTALLRDYPTYSADWVGWQAGADRIIAYFEQQHGRYNTMLMSADFNAPDELLRFYSVRYPDRCAACLIVNTDDWRNVHASYRPSTRQLWAIAPQQLSHSELGRAPYRIVHHITYPNGQTSFLFIATGPESSSTSALQTRP